MVQPLHVQEGVPTELRGYYDPPLDEQRNYRWGALDAATELTILRDWVSRVQDTWTMNVLWVENHPHFARLAGRQFLGDHAVTVVPSLAGARAALAGGSFDAVLIDFDLDDGKGDELARELRASPDRPWVVAVSSHEAGNWALVEAGADEVCGKLAFGRIGEVLRRLAGRSPGA